MLFPVFFDTCTLYGALVSDLVLRFAENRLYRRIGHRVCWMSWNECWVSALAKIKPASVFAR